MCILFLSSLVTLHATLPEETSVYLPLCRTLHAYACSCWLALPSCLFAQTAYVVPWPHADLLGPVGDLVRPVHADRLGSFALRGRARVPSALLALGSVVKVVATAL